MPIAITNNSIIWYGGIPDPFTPTTNPGGPQGVSQPQYRLNTQFGPLSLIKGVVASGGTSPWITPNLQSVTFQASPQGWAIGPGYLWATEYVAGVGEEPYETAGTRMYHFAGTAMPQNPAGTGSDGMGYFPIQASPGATITIIGSTYGSNAPQGAFGIGTSGNSAYLTKGGSSPFSPYFNAPLAPRSSEWFRIPFTVTGAAPVSTSNILGTHLPQPVVYFGGRLGSAPDKAHGIRNFSNQTIPITSIMPTPAYSPQITYTTFPWASETATQIAGSASLPGWVSAAAPATNGWYYRNPGAWNFYSAQDGHIHMGQGSAIRATVWGQAGYVKYPTASVNSVTVAAQLATGQKTSDGKGIYSSYGVGSNADGSYIFGGGGTYAPSPPTTGTNQWALVTYPVASNTTINQPAYSSYQPNVATPGNFPQANQNASTQLPMGSPINIVSGSDSKLYISGGYNTSLSGQVRVVPTVTAGVSTAFVNTYAQTPTPLIRRNGRAFGV
ncbi:hypothetical protein OAL25_00130 [bacterium]|nr:hypothetical protein [bacterium]